MVHKRGKEKQLLRQVRFPRKAAAEIKIVSRQKDSIRLREASSSLLVPVAVRGELRSQLELLQLGQLSRRNAVTAAARQSQAQPR